GRDQDRSAVADHGIDVLDLVVGDGDAACGPVKALLGKDASFGALTVDKDVAACAAPQRRGAGGVFCIRIRDPDREVIAAVGVTAVDIVQPLGGFAVALILLMANRLIAKTDPVRFEHRVAALNLDLRSALVYRDVRFTG